MLFQMLYSSVRDILKCAAVILIQTHCYRTFGIYFFFNGTFYKLIFCKTKIPTNCIHVLKYQQKTKLVKTFEKLFLKYIESTYLTTYLITQMPGYLPLYVPIFLLVWSYRNIDMIQSINFILTKKPISTTGNVNLQH